MAKIHEVVEGATFKKMLDILLIRRLLEPQAAADCCIYASESQLLELENLKFDLVTDKGVGFIANEKDLKLHLLIAKSCGNLFLYSLMEIILSDFSGHINWVSLEKPFPTIGVNLIDAIQKRDLEGSKNAMKNHIDDMIHYLEENYQ
jgi:DNA-binding FadR family transcriptional regulator